MEQQRNYRWLLVVQLYLVTALWGAVQASGDFGRLRFIFTCLQASAVSTWLVLDARPKGRLSIRIVQELHVFLWLFLAPIYLIKTRGFLRGFFLSLAHAIGITCVNQASFYTHPRLNQRVLRY